MTLTKKQTALIAELTKLGLSDEEIKSRIAEKLPSIKARSELPVIIELSEYEGNQMLVLKRGATGRPFSFGKAKASMILEAIAQIESFVAGK